MGIYKKLHELLISAGLSEVETLTYIELLKKPAQNVWDLVKRTGLPKTVIYRAFERLENLHMVQRTEIGIRTLSLKTLVSEISKNTRKLSKTAYQIKKIAPFLRAPKDSIETFDTYYTPEQIAEIYLSLSDLDYGVSLDFGDFENFVPTVHSAFQTVQQFRKNRLKHAINRAICTTYGPYTAEFCTKEAKSKFKNFVNVLDGGMNRKFVVFDDKTDYVMFNDFSDTEFPQSVLVKSRPIAQAQRSQFSMLSQKFGNS